MVAVMDDHAGRAMQILESVIETRPGTAELIAIAQVHATLALANAVESWQPPTPPGPAPIPFEQTKGGWSWP